jgi:hypothetical protein
MSEQAPHELGLFAGNGWARRTKTEEVAAVVEKGFIPDDVRSVGLQAEIRERVDGFHDDPRDQEDFWRGFLEGAQTFLVARGAADAVAKQD